MANGIVTGGLYSVNGMFALAGTAVGRGTFVVPTYGGGAATPTINTSTAATPTADALKDVYFVMNAITTPKELAQDNADFTVAVGTKLELAKFQLGATFITDQFDSTFASYSVGTVVMVGTSGKLKADSSGVFKATVTEKITSWCGANALRCIVTAV
jgi:hypothetical protein